MLKQIYATAILIVTITVAKGQAIAEKSFADIIGGLPKTPDSLQQAVNNYGRLPMGETPAAFRSALDELNVLRERILKPLYEKLLVAGKGSLTAYSPEEQKLLRDMQTLHSAWGDGVMYGFDTWIEYRPGIAKQFWTKPKQTLSPIVQGYYSQLQQIEKSLVWERFLDEASAHEGLVFQDAKLDAVNAETNQALQAVPTRKRRFAEGSDVMVDMPDREKTIAVLKKFDAKKMYVFRQLYNEQYAWWQTNYARITAAAKKLDVILQSTHFGEGLQGNDAQLRTAIADVQARIVSMLYHLTNISTKIISIAQQAYVSGQVVEEYIRSSS